MINITEHSKICMIGLGKLGLPVAEVMSQKYDTQEYQVMDQIGKIEIRYYPSAPMIRVSSNQSRNNNFGKLFRYIAGNNNNEEKIAHENIAIIIDKSPLLKFKFFIIVISAFVIIENTPIKDNISPVIWYKFVFSMLSTDDIIIIHTGIVEIINKLVITCV